MLKLFSVPEMSLSERNRSNAILRKIIWSILIVMSIGVVIAMYMEPTYIYRYFIIISLLWGISIWILFYTKNISIYNKTIIYISFLLLLIFGAAWTGGGIRSHALIFLPDVVLCSGLILGRKQIWKLGIIVVLCTLFLVLADVLNIIAVRELIGQQLMIYWLYTTCCVLLLCFFQHLSLDELRNALNETQTELLLREKSENLLNQKNEKLIEIAFLQSHIVRKPVANVLGFINIIKTCDPTDLVYKELLTTLEVSAKELDAVIHEIVKKTDEIESLKINQLGSNG